MKLFNKQYSEDKKLLKSYGCDTVRELTKKHAIKLEDLTRDYNRAADNRIHDTRMNTESTAQTHKLEIEKLMHNDAQEIDSKNFEMKYNKDKEILEAKQSVIVAEKEAAILKKELEITQKLINVNGDIIDIKELVKSLIAKLPEIDLKNINITTQCTKPGVDLSSKI